MRAWHTTLRRNLPSIFAVGIQASRSQGKRKAVWVHALEHRSWAFLHTVKRHGGRVEDVVSLCVDIPDDHVKCSSVRGLFYVLEDVPPEFILGMVQFDFVAASPLEERKAARGSKVQ